MDIRQHFITEVFAVVNKYSQLIVNDIQREWGRWPEVQGRANADYIFSIAQEEIISEIFGEGQKALILEYGRGSLMDTNNPALPEYIDSPEFNKLRLNPKKGKPLSIVGREQGEYKDLDGNIHYSSGKMAGVNLEEKYQNDSRFKPNEPLHIVRNALDGYLQLIEEELLDVLIDFPYEKLFPEQIRL